VQSGLDSAVLEKRETVTVAEALRVALAAAEAFAGATAPNPPVGCVILDKDGVLLATAAHRRAGTPHAEALAIDACRRAGTLPRIHTVVVTLEPCNHFGRTPPCAEAILNTPAQRVVIGAADPNPKVCGGGADRLIAAGIDVMFMERIDKNLAAQSRRLIAPFAKWSKTGLPFVTVKQALDETGSMSPPPGQKTFTSPSSLDLAHRLRRRADAMMTGSGTILADLPEFTVRRVPDHPAKRRVLTILDRRGRVPESYLEQARHRGFDPLIATDVAEALTALGEKEVLEVLVEAGPQLTSYILHHALWDEHVLIRKSANGQDDVSITHRSHPG
jgi:diaminohydroxyphosphoribosylaminopyrimidine deaminase/5-amino-6-(5-phosphoribosylamino)uracil reductase